MRPLQISPDTAIKLSEKLGVPIEKLMHMPQHILLEKMMEIASEQESENSPVSPEIESSEENKRG